MKLLEALKAMRQAKGNVPVQLFCGYTGKENANDTGRVLIDEYIKHIEGDGYYFLSRTFRGWEFIGDRVTALLDEASNTSAYFTTTIKPI